MTSDAPAFGHAALLALAEEYEDCDRCPLLCSTRKNVVFGSGSSRAPIMVIGDAPTLDDDYTGAPFSGKAGELFCDLFAKAWPADDRMRDICTIQEDVTYFEQLREYLDSYVFWTSSVLCATPDGREPSKEETKHCLSRLHRAIYAVDPILIVAAGKASASLLLGKTVQITDKHGTIFDVSVPSPVTGAPVRYAMLTLLHPTYLLKKGDQQLVKKKQGSTYETILDLEHGLDLLNQLHETAYGRSFLEKE